MLNTYKQLLKSTTPLERSTINITVGLSGGVDSATTAYLLKEAGFNVRGVYMLCFDDGTPNCRSSQDKSDAIKVASFLNIPIEIWDYQKEYKERVIDYFVGKYKKGLTPNPDILCNSEIKFKLFLEEAIKKGADYVATGHYAKIIKNEEFKIKNSKSEEFSAGSLCLSIPKDKTKDQTYFLSDINSTTYNKILFPLGDYLKTEVRDMAHTKNIPVADKKDSTGICFLEGVKMQDFLMKNIKEKTGPVILKTGEKIGTHKGVWFYTIGQRHGFTTNKYIGKPLYVIDKKPTGNELIVGEKKELLKTTINVHKITNYKLQITNSQGTFIRIRNLGKLVPIENIVNVGDISIIKLSKKIDAVAPGQFAVIYKKINSNYFLIAKGEIT